MANNGKCILAQRLARGLNVAMANGASLADVSRLTSHVESVRTRIRSGLDLDSRDTLDAALCRAYLVKSGLADDGWTGSEAPPLSRSAPYGRHFQRVQQVIQAHGATGVDNDHIGYG
jgi:hypothetical protein